MALALGTRSGPAVFVGSQRALQHFGKPYGHGLHQIGLDLTRLLLVDTRTEKDALWALEETLRSKAHPAIVGGAIENSLNLTVSRRLNLAAAMHTTPLVILHPSQTGGNSAAATRWRIGAAPAARDRFGSFAHWRWNVSLERSRNGRPGQWMFEWNHVTHHFRVVEVLADRPSVASTDFRLAG
jgi:protein ImuA